MNVLITGGAGFIGYHLAAYHVARGDTVTIFDSLFKSSGRVDVDFTSLTDNACVSMHSVDLTEPIGIALAHESLDVVYHLAAINGTQLFYEMPYEVARNNLLMTLNLLDWLGGREVGCLLYSSSSEVYADADQFGLLTIPTDEDVPVVFGQPTSVRFSYGTSKFMGEFLCLQYGVKFKTPTCVVRYHNIYGPRMGMRHVIPEFIQRLRDGESPFRVFGGTETRAFCYVDDAVRATALVASTGEAAGHVVHVGNSAEEVEITRLAEMMMKLTHTSAAIDARDGREGSVARRCPDITKLQALTGFTPVVALEDGLRKTIDWYMAHS